MLLNTNVTLHSEIEILAEYKAKLEAKEASEGGDPKKNEELKRVEALHKRQLTIYLNLIPVFKRICA